jgi:hypothetical protein
VSSVSFFQQDQSFFQSNAATSLNLTTVARLFGSSSVPSTSSSSGTTAATDSTLGVLGTTLLHSSLNANVLAAQEADTRIENKVQSVESNGQPTTSAPDVSTQVTYSGSLQGDADFGKAGPAPSGGYEFLSGSALQAAFKTAIGPLTSNGSAINTVSVSGDTLTASTSGTNAHPVFSLTLHPQSGLFTFTLLNPIDQKSSLSDEFKQLDLSGLVQSVNADGQTSVLANAVTIQVHNKQGDARTTQIQVPSGTGGTTLANAGVIFEGGLAYTGPDNPTPSTTPTKPAKYVPPTNPLTGRPYSASAGATAANFGAVNILT